MIVLFICNEANQQLVTEREVIKDALNTCLRPESFMRLESMKVPPPAAVQTRFLSEFLSCRRNSRNTGLCSSISSYIFYNVL